LNLTPFFLPEAPAPARFELNVPTEADQIDAAISKVVGFLLQSGLPEITAFELQTILYEIMTNIRLHGRLQPDDTISVHLRVEGRTVTLGFADGGVSFDPTGHNPVVDPQEAGRQHQRRGFGLAMVKGLSDKIDYHRTADQRNQLTVTKSW
jgi:anti-sigma regulatory factor (Ser/Thr protein kinase)